MIQVIRRKKSVSAVSFPRSFNTMAALLSSYLPFHHPQPIKNEVQRFSTILAEILGANHRRRVLKAE